MFIMRKLLVLLLCTTTTVAFSQKKKFDLSERAGDHLMFQISHDSWMGTPDSIDSHIDGFSRGANVYIMLDKPFKGNPRFSFGFGLGVSTSHIFFEKMEIDIEGTNPVLQFRDVNGQNHFKKYKLATAYLELPVEFRYTANPAKPNKTIKAAIGAKVGTMLNAHTKGKNLRNASGTSISAFTQKNSTKAYFNSTRITGTARAGYGNFSLFAAYSFSPVFKDGVAADINLLQVGLTLSGL